MRRVGLESRSGEGHSRQKGQQVQRPWGCNELGKLKEQKGGSVWLTIKGKEVRGRWIQGGELGTATQVA